MYLTPEQLQTIRNATKDESAYDAVIKVFEDAATSPIENLFNLSQDQIKNIQAVIDTLPVSLYIKDKDSRFLMANQATVNRHQMTRYKDIIGKTDFDLMDESMAQHHAELEKSLLLGERSVLNYEVYRNDDENASCALITKSPIFDAEGNIIGLIGMNQDITQRYRAQQKLQDERNLLQTIIDNIQDKVYVKNREGRFTMANASMLRQQAKYGITLDELIGKTDYDFMNPERAEVMFREEQEIMNSGEPILNQELLTPDHLTGRGDLWFLVSKVPIKGDSGEIIGLVGVNRDITSRKIAQQRELEVQVEREKSRFLQSFINDSSHEFRTPLSVIRTATYLLSKVNDPSQYPKYIDQIKSQTERIENLIDDLNLMISLDSSPIIQKRAFKFSNTMHFLKDYARHHQLKHTDFTVTFDCDPNISTYFGDESLLDLALQRILDNALRYSSEDGKVIVRARSQADNIVVTIEDDGIGMSDDTIQLIFQRFFRADPSRTISGFGLGLPIARSIIALHNGTITVNSTPETGSVFTITLPYSEN